MIHDAMAGNWGIRQEGKPARGKRQIENANVLTIARPIGEREERRTPK
jgi:hypothetical protein